MRLPQRGRTHITTRVECPTSVEVSRGDLPRNGPEGTDHRGDQPSSLGLEFLGLGFRVLGFLGFRVLGF